MSQQTIATRPARQPQPQRTIYHAPPDRAPGRAAAARLAAVELEFARAQVALADLAGLLHQVAHHAPACGPAALALRMLRRELRATWENVESDVLDALEETRP